MNISDQPMRIPTWVAIAVVAVSTVLLYAQTLGMGFVSDDANTILSNTALHSLRNLPQLFTMGLWPSGSAAEFTYRPVFLAAMAFDYALWGDAPAGYHLISMLLHAVNAVLVFLIFRRLLRDTLPALLAALVFAAHPIQVESVAWVSARCGLMSAGFALAAFVFYLHYRDSRQVALLAGSLALYALGIFSKEDVIVFPALILLAELCLFRWEPRFSLVVTGAYGAVAAGYLVARTLVLRSLPESGLPLTERLLTAPGIVIEYLRLLLLPTGQKVFYDLPVQQDFWAAGVLIPLLLLAILGGIWGYAWFRERRVFFALGWIAITVALFSGVLFMPRPSLMATRYLYLPAVGVCFLLGLLVERFLRGADGAGRGRQRLVVIAGALLLVVFAGISWQRSQIWRDDVVFRAAFVADAPLVPQGHNGQGANFYRAGDFQQAEAAFRRALKLAPTYYDAHFNLGMTYLAQKRTVEAAGQFRRVLELQPSFPDALDQLGLLSLQQGRYDEALGYFARAQQIDRNNRRYQDNYRVALRLKGGR